MTAAAIAKQLDREAAKLRRIGLDDEAARLRAIGIVERQRAAVRRALDETNVTARPRHAA